MKTFEINKRTDRNEFVYNDISLCIISLYESLLWMKYSHTITIKETEDHIAIFNDAVTGEEVRIQIPKTPELVLRKLVIKTHDKAYKTGRDSMRSEIKKLLEI